MIKTKETNVRNPFKVVGRGGGEAAAEEEEGASLTRNEIRRFVRKTKICPWRQKSLSNAPYCQASVAI